MNKILVTYATLSGTTVEVAQAIGEEITKTGMQAEVLPLEKVTNLDSYDGVVLGHVHQPDECDRTAGGLFQFHEHRDRDDSDLLWRRRPAGRVEHRAD